MLESILQKFRGIALAFMIIMLSAVFVLQFGGPQADGCSKRSGALYAAEVYGEKISLNEYRAAFALVGGDRYPAEMVKQYQLDSMVLHGLVERSLLDGRAGELRGVQGDQRLRPRQAAGMGGQDSVCAALHRVAPQCHVYEFGTCLLSRRFGGWQTLQDHVFRRSTGSFAAGGTTEEYREGHCPSHSPFQKVNQRYCRDCRIERQAGQAPCDMLPYAPS